MWITRKNSLMIGIFSHFLILSKNFIINLIHLHCKRKKIIEKQKRYCKCQPLSVKFTDISFNPKTQHNTMRHSLVKKNRKISSYEHSSLFCALFSQNE